MRIFRCIVAALLLVPFAPVVTAQESLLNMEIRLDQDNFDITLGSQVVFHVTVKDWSVDGTGNVPGGPAYGFQHTLHFELHPHAQKRGWYYDAPPPTTISSGEERTARFIVGNTPQVDDPFFVATVVVRMVGAGSEITRNATITAYTLGAATFSVVPLRGYQIGPQDITAVPVRLTNLGLAPRAFDFAVTDNPCGGNVVAPASAVVGARASEIFYVTVEAPSERLRYVSESCATTLVVTPADNPNLASTIKISGQVNGWYVDPAWVLWSIGLFVLAAIIFLLVSRRKARIEEEILGKPQKPWTIPVEMVYLDYLKERDPQAHYVVRHYLMEEEYSSAMAWYREYKKATRGSRAKERLVVNQEHKYARFRKKWKKRIAKPQKKVDSYAAGLQKKLDRRGKKGLRKDRRKWKKLTKKMKAAHEKKRERATKKWEKKAKRAQKKKQPVPEKPVLATPDYPPEPSKDKVELAKHPWNAKVEKARRKAVKKQGNLEVKFEKEDAKVLRKVRKRVHKIARKLDDPDFAAEHPILAKDAKST